MDIAKIVKYTGNIVFSTLLAFGIYAFGFLGSVNRISHIYSPRIESESELEHKINILRERWGLSKDVSIHGIIADEKSIQRDNIWGESYTKKIGNNEYEIVLVEPSDGDLIHEFFHIADGQVDKKEECGKLLFHLKYYFWWEPKTAFYGLTHRKINDQKLQSR